MELKHQVLKILEENRGSSVNGAKLAESLFVTRSSIWKAVKALQREGHSITAVTNRGYCLLSQNDILSAESIRPYLRGRAADFSLDVRQSVTSTNTLAKAIASEGAREGTIIIAGEQTEGRGRMGRSFYSPGATGIYLSLILRPQLNMEDSLLITTATAVAVARAIEKTAGVRAGIKWVNDIFVGGKKVCGILTEASINFETGGLEYAVVGIGVNVSTTDFPTSIQETAGSLFLQKPENLPITTLLTAEILNQLSECMETLTDRNYLEEYRHRQIIIGKNILVLKGNESRPAKALTIDDQARLIVEYEDKTQETLSSGEVSIRPLKA